MQSDTERLMFLQSLDAATLAEYRNGLLPPAQRERLMGSRRIAWIMFAVALVPSAIAALLAATGLVGDMTPAGVLVAGGGWTLVIGLLDAFAWLESLGPVADARAGVVACIEGAVAKSIISGGRSGAHYWIAVSGERFDLAGERQTSVWAALTESQGYRVYYLPRTREVLAIEPATAR